MKTGTNAFQLLIETLVAIRRRPPSVRRITAEAFECGNRSILFVCVTMAFFGLILVYEGCVQALNLIPDLSAAGPATIRSTIRVFGPTFTGLMAAFRLGAGISAEAATMVVTEQDGALRVTGSSPAAWLVAPRLLACVGVLPALTVLGCLSAIGAGGLLGWLHFDIPPSVFFSLGSVDAGDAVTGGIKAVLNGVVIPVIAAAAGLRTRGGAEGVGISATDAVVRASVAVVIVEFAVSTTARFAGL